MHACTFLLHWAKPIPQSMPSSTYDCLTLSFSLSLDVFLNIFYLILDTIGRAFGLGFSGYVGVFDFFGMGWDGEHDLLGVALDGDRMGIQTGRQR